MKAKPEYKIEQAENSDLLSEPPLIDDQRWLSIELGCILHTQLVVMVQISLLKRDQQIIQPLIVGFLQSFKLS